MLKTGLMNCNKLYIVFNPSTHQHKLGELVARQFTKSKLGKTCVDEWYDTMRFCEPNASETFLRKYSGISKLFI